MSQTAQQRARAEYLFYLYYQAGPGRSLRTVWADLTMLGLKLGYTTMKSYSSKFGWIQRAKDLDEEAREKLDALAVTQLAYSVDLMNQRQAGFGRALQDTAQGALERLAKEDLTGAGVAALAREGVKIERLAAGEVTERHGIMVQLYGRFLIEIAGIAREAVAFLPEPDQVRVLEVWARGVDALATDRVAEMEEARDV